MPPQPQPSKNKTQLSAFLRRPDAPPSSQLTSDPFEPLPRSTPLRGSPVPPPAPRVLAVEIPLSVLRPIAFRIFTKKHNLTLKSDALVLLCQSVGRRCGTDWRDSGAGEKLLDEVARRWKRAEPAGKILVDGGEVLKSVLKGMDVPTGNDRPALSRTNSSFDLGMGGEIPSSMLLGGGEIGRDTEMGEEERDEIEDKVDPKEYFKIVDAFEQPKMVYSATKKTFERGPKPTLFPPPTAKTALFRSRYNILHSRLLRNDAFLAPTYQKSSTSSKPKSFYKLTLISALLGRAGQNFLLFGMLGHSPSGTLSLYDPTGEITLDTALTQPLPDADANWFCPGMFVILDGVYEEDGRFTVFTALSPPPERRETSAEVFGHVDFLGNGISLEMSSPVSSGQQGRIMRKVETALSEVRWAALGEVTLDAPRTLEALRHVFGRYSSSPPMLLILSGNFSSIPVAPGDGNAIRAYKELFDGLASLLSDFPSICAETTLLFIPGDNDPWASTFSGGSSACWPRRSVPEVFLGRVKRVAKDVRCASSPCRIGYFSSEVVVCRDDIAGRLQRGAIRFATKRDEKDIAMDLDDTSTTATTTTTTAMDEGVKLARKLVKTVLDQGFLSPFPLARRPVLWDFAHSLSLYPLPSALLLVDSQVQPYTVTYEGCHAMNPGRFVARRKARWIEYTPSEKRGVVVEEGF